MEINCVVDDNPTSPQHTLSNDAQGLHEVLAAYEEVLAHVNQGISCFDKDFRLRVCNARYLELLNFPPELGQPGTPFESFIRYNAERGEYGPGDVEAQVQVRVEAARKRQPHRFERTRPGDGTTLEIIGTPLADGGFVTTYADISERKRHEAELEEAQHRLELALEGAALGLWDWDVASGRVICNARFHDMLGRDAESVSTADKINLMIHPDDRAARHQAIMDHLRGDSLCFEFEHRALHLDNHWRWVLGRGKVVARDANGRALRVIGTMLDITARKRNEALLQERERRLATLVRSMQDLIFVLDTGGTIIEFWPAGAIDFGLEPAQAIGRDAAEVLPASMREPVANAMVELFMDATSTRFEFEIIQTGRSLHLQATMSRLADAGKYATGYLVVVRDVSEVQELRSALERSAAASSSNSPVAD